MSHLSEGWLEIDRKDEMQMHAKGEEDEGAHWRYRLADQA